MDNKIVTALKYAVDILTPGRTDGPQYHHLQIFLKQAITALAEVEPQICASNYGQPHDYSLSADGNCIYCSMPESQPQEVQPVAWLITWPKGATTVKDADVSVHQYIAIGCTAEPLYTHSYNPAALTEAGFASVEDLLAAWQGAQQPREGWKLVPIEPTEAMLKAAFHNYHKTHIYDAQRPYQAHASTYAAILAAAPAPENKK